MGLTPRIILSRAPTLPIVLSGIPEGCLVVRHRSFACEMPRQRSARFVDFESFEGAPWHWIKGAAGVVFLGLSRAMTPSNRTREVWEVLFNLTPHLPKWSVDRTLFIGEPWRAWFHFGLVGAPYAEYTYSYLAETHWRAHRDGLRDDDPFSLAALTRWGRGVVHSLHDRHFGIVRVETVETDAETKAAYAELKAQAFDEETTLAGILRRLSAFAAEVCPQRRIPTRAVLFNRPDHHIVRTDLAVDAFLTNELLGLVELTNGIAAAFSGNVATQQGVLL